MYHILVYVILLLMALQVMQRCQVAKYGLQAGMGTVGMPTIRQSGMCQDHYEPHTQRVRYEQQGWNRTVKACQAAYSGTKPPLSQSWHGWSQTNSVAALHVMK